MFLHAYSLHRTERIKWRLEFFADWKIIWPVIRKRLHRHRVHSLSSQLNDFILAAIEWAQRDFRFWFKVSVTQLQYIITTHPRFFFFFFPHLFFLRQSKDQQCYSPCTWFFTDTRKKKHYFEYEACWTRCLNQIYENTNLHLLSVWRGFPYRNKGLGFPKPKLEVQKWNENLIFAPNQNILYNNQPLTADTSC